LPGDFGAAIAIVMHLSPDQESILAGILDSRSSLLVKQARTGDFRCRSRVFVAPPNHRLLVDQDGRLRLSSAGAEKVHYARPSAEPPFFSVAKVCRTNAIAVVLTGGDGDGSFAVQVIKDQGGVVIAFANITVAKTLEAKLRGQHASMEKDVADHHAKRAKAGSLATATKVGKRSRHNGKAPRSRPQ